MAVRVELTGAYLTIFETIASSGEAGVTVDELIDAVYPGLTKTPEWPRSSVVSMVRHVRAKLPEGTSIVSTMGRRVNRYWLEVSGAAAV